MPRFQIEMNGKRFEVEAPDQSAALNAVQGISVQKEQPINEGDWSGLQERLNTTEQRVKDSGPYRPQDIDATLKGEAKRQGLLYGQERAGQEGIGGIFGGSAANTLGLGLPRYLEAVTNPTVKTAYAHEFLKAADEGRAKAAPIASGAGTVAGYVGQAALMPVSGAASLGGRALSAAGQSGTLAALEAGIESRGDLGQVAKSGLTGALAGGAASAGMEKVLQAGRRFIDPLRGLAKSGPADEQATARILLAAKNAGIDDATAQRKLAELGPEGFIADLLGAKGQGLARASANISPDARELLENASQGRIAGQQDRLIAALEDAASGVPLGKTAQGPMPRVSAPSIEDAQRGVYERAKPAVTGAYDDAAAAGFAQPLNRPGWMDAPIFQEALDHAKATTQNRIALYGEKEGSQFGLLDAARQYLANKAKDFRDPKAIDYGNAAKKMNAFVDENVAGAAEARKLAQGYKQQQAALETGADLARTRPQPGTLAEAGATPYPGQTSQGYAIGKRNEINQRAPGKRTVDIIDGTPTQRNALVAALGDRAGNVTRQTAAERKFLEFNNALSGNSTTARQLAELGFVGGTAGAGYMTGFDPMQAGSIAGAAVLAKRGGSKLMEALAKKNEAAVAPEVARKLIERSLPKLVDAKGKPITETARRRLVEALMQVGGKGGAIAYGQN